MDEKLKQIVDDVKKKKELQHLQQGYVLERVQEYLAQNPSAEKFVREKFQVRSEKYKQIIKGLRSRLRRKFGLFQKNSAPKSSTEERTNFYPLLFPKLFSVTGKPHSIIDLGCGKNPFFLPLMKLKKLEYHAYDIDEKQIKDIQQFFDAVHSKNKQFHGKAEIKDITKVENLQKLPSANICFLFKVTDILDQGKGHKKTEEVMKAVPAQHLIISFPTVTMSGKTMNAPRRKWMEWLCARLGYKYTVVEFPTEIFYVVEK